jgi:hypothetical protein
MNKSFKSWDEALAFARSITGSIVSRAQNGSGFQVEYEAPIESEPIDSKNDALVRELKAQVEALSHVTSEKDSEIVSLMSKLADSNRRCIALMQDKQILSENTKKTEEEMIELKQFRSRENLISGFFPEEDILLIKTIIRNRAVEKRKAERITKDCKCLGTNSNCSFCSGKGYFITDGNGQIQN